MKLIIHIDKYITWERTAGDLNDNLMRRYYAAPAPWLAVMVVREELAGNTAEELTGGKFDCSIGTHDASAPLGFTLPQYRGWAHSKLTLRSEVDKGTPHDITLTEFLEGCPTAEEMEGKPRNPNIISSTLVAVNLPELLHERARQLAPLHGHDMETLIWYLLMEFVQDSE